MVETSSLKETGDLEMSDSGSPSRLLVHHKDRFKIGHLREEFVKKLFFLEPTVVVNLQITKHDKVNEWHIVVIGKL